MKIRKFPSGGVHLPEEKSLTSGKLIKPMEVPVMVAVPLHQHIGAPCDSIVELGQDVERGECVGRYDGALSARVHASITGRVVGIEKRGLGDGTEVGCVVIRGPEKGREEPEEHLDRIRREPVDREEVISSVQWAGIAGMGGACFPTHVKLDPPPDKPIDTVIINGAECEPFITVDHRLMLEYPNTLLRGLDLIRTTVGAERGIVACEINKPDALEVLKEVVEDDWPALQVVPLDTRYPHGAEKHLIKAVLDREVPLRQLPMEVGVVVNNVQTTLAVAEAVDEERSLTSRVLTASGRALKEPSNLRVPLGTSLRDVIEYCGGTVTDEYQTGLGGPMTGRRVEDLDIPVSKGTSGIVLLPRDEYAARDSRACIRCGKCVKGCPMYLAPNRIVGYVNSGMYQEAERAGVLDCIECGACAFVCPSKRPLIHWIREGKAALNKQDHA